MIKSVSINGFKALDKLETVPLSKITLIGGKNNTGKTTFLEALFFYLDFNYSAFIEKVLVWRDVNRASEVKEKWKKFFYNFDFSTDINILINSEKKGNERLYINYINDYETSGPIQVIENGITLFKRNFSSLEITHSCNDSIDYRAYILNQGLNYNYLKEIDLLQDQPSGYYIGERMRLQDKNTEYLGILDKSDEQEKILPLLRIFEPNLIRLQTIPENGINLIYADFGNRKKMPVNMLGDGFCRCLTIALILASKSAEIFLIDEVASGIHYSIQEDFWTFLVEASRLYECQIIATTHSYDTIKAFNSIINSNNPSDYAYIRFGKKDDIIKPYVFNAETLNYSISSDLEIR